MEHPPPLSQRDAAGSPPHGIQRTLLLAGVGLAAFALVSAALDRRLGPAGGDELTSWKQMEVLRRPSSYDTVFLGSSRVYRGVVPAVFDDRLRQEGLNVRSFNLALQGTRLHEVHYLLRRLLRQRQGSGGSLQRVFVEYVPFRPELQPDNRFKPRLVYWHDWVETRLASAATLRLERPLGASLATVWDHWRHFGARALGLGRWSHPFQQLRLDLGFDLSRSTVRLEMHEAGFLDLDRHQDLSRILRQRSKEFEEAVSEHLAAVDAMRAEADYRANWFQSDWSTWRQMAAECRAARVELIGVLMPVTRRSSGFMQEFHAETGLSLLAFNDPERYPLLFAPEHQFDVNHLNETGARLFSRILAETYLEWSELED